MPTAIERLETARREGIDVSFDMYPYPAGSSTILQLLPPSARPGAASPDRASDDETEREKLRRAVETGEAPNDPGWESKVLLIGWENVRIGGVGNEALREVEGRSLSEIAASRGMSPFETVIWLIREDGGCTNIVMFQLDEKDLRTALTHPLHMLGSDSLPREGGKPHPRAYGSFPRYVGHCARDLGWLRIEDAVRHMTAVPAQRFGLFDRGLVRRAWWPIWSCLLMPSPTARPSRSRLACPGHYRRSRRRTAVMRDGATTGSRPGRVLTRH